ncbi:MAG: cation:proton antiporter [Phycisphaeraceae bacterium]|nr:cation:proton antiporter [Phycisphaeraceae bacterium]
MTDIHWGLTLAEGNLSTGDVAALFLSLAVLLGLARLLGEQAQRWGQPAILGEILAGVLLGPTVLGALSPSFHAMIAPIEGPVRSALDGLFVLSAALLLLVAGLEVELSTVWRQGKSALSVGLWAVAIPFVLGSSLGWFLPGAVGMQTPVSAEQQWPFALFMGVALSITALPVIAKILMDMNLAKSDIGVIVISAAMLNDLIGWLGFALLLAMISPQGAGAAGLSGVGLTVVLTLLFVGLMLTVGRWLFHRVLPHLQAHWSWPGGVLGFIIVMAFLGAAATEAMGIHAIFGAFIAGIAIGDSRHLRERTRETVNQFISYVFAPLFFVSIGLRVNFLDAFDPVAVAVVLVVAVTGKLTAGFLGARLAGISRRESAAIGFGMSAQGAMGIILGQLALQAELIHERTFVAIVVMALVTSLIAGPAIERLLERKQRRKLGDLLTERHFISRMSSATARQAIAELSERAATLTKFSKEAIFDAAWAREQIVRTGLGHGLAMPHARLAGLDKSLMVVGRDVEGIDFDAPDGQNARFVCLLLTPADDPSAQLELMALLAKSLASEEARQHALEASNFTEFLAALTVSSTRAEE